MWTYVNAYPGNFGRKKKKSPLALSKFTREINMGRKEPWARDEAHTWGFRSTVMKELSLAPNYLPATEEVLQRKDEENPF